MASIAPRTVYLKRQHLWAGVVGAYSLKSGEFHCFTVMVKVSRVSMLQYH